MTNVLEKLNPTALKAALGTANIMAVPKIEKIVVSVGTGSVSDKAKLEVIKDRLKKITGQESVARTAKKSIAGFKSRQGQTVGYQTTIRGARMKDFLNKFLNFALPRTRDFRGIKRSAVDASGNLTIGITEHTIFPETSDEELKDIFGFAVTIATTAKTKAEALAFFEHIGVPFRAEEKNKK